MDGSLGSEEDVERLRRSVVMLPPGRLDGLNRATALQVLDELQRLQDQDRRVRALVAELQNVLDESSR